MILRQVQFTGHIGLAPWLGKSNRSSKILYKTGPKSGWLFFHFSRSLQWPALFLRTMHKLTWSPCINQDHAFSLWSKLKASGFTQNERDYETHEQKQELLNYNASWHVINLIFWESAGIFLVKIELSHVMSSLNIILYKWHKCLISFWLSRLFLARGSVRGMP